MAPRMHEGIADSFAILGGRKALRVTPRGKQWLTVYRAHQVLKNKGEANRAETGWRISEKYFHKNQDISSMLRQICAKSVLDGDY